MPVTYTFYIVSLKKETAKQNLNETSNLSEMRNNVEFSNTSLGETPDSGLVMLNPEHFNIHYTDCFDLGGRTNFSQKVETTNLADSRRRRAFSFAHPRVIKCGVTESWNEMSAADLEPSDRLFEMLFYNNYGGQLSAFHA